MYKLNKEAKFIINKSDEILIIKYINGNYYKNRNINHFEKNYKKCLKLYQDPNGCIPWDFTFNNVNANKIKSKFDKFFFGNEIETLCYKKSGIDVYNQYWTNEFSKEKRNIENAKQHYKFSTEKKYTHDKEYYLPLCPVCSRAMDSFEDNMDPYEKQKEKNVEHLIPKTWYKPFTYLSSNLFFCCPTCNTNTKYKINRFHPVYNEVPVIKYDVNFNYGNYYNNNINRVFIMSATFSNFKSFEKKNIIYITEDNNEEFGEALTHAFSKFICKITNEVNYYFKYKDIEITEEDTKTKMFFKKIIPNKYVTSIIIDELYFWFTEFEYHYFQYAFYRFFIEIMSAYDDPCAFYEDLNNSVIEENNFNKYNYKIKVIKKFVDSYKPN